MQFEHDYLMNIEGLSNATVHTSLTINTIQLHELHVTMNICGHTNKSTIIFLHPDMVRFSVQHVSMRMIPHHPTMIFLEVVDYYKQMISHMLLGLLKDVPSPMLLWTVSFKQQISSGKITDKLSEPITIFLKQIFDDTKKHIMEFAFRSFLMNIGKWVNFEDIEKIWHEYVANDIMTD
jgi:hypothetical protein